MSGAVERIAAARAEAVADRLVAALAGEPGVRVTREGGDVIVTGRALDTVAALRWPAGLVR